MIRWAILTGEYPPQVGGVSDYTRLVAEALAAVGDEVAVYAPPQNVDPDPSRPWVRMRRLPDRFGLRGLRWLDRELARDRPDRLLIQYVPHAFGLKAMNVPFAAWVFARARRVAPIWVMFHEVAYPFVRRPLRHNVIAIANRAMAWAVAGAADRVLVSIPSWDQLLRQICPQSRPAEWLPVPCNVATVADPRAVAAARSQYAPDPSTRLIGHFGTFGRLITNLLEAAVAGVLRAEPRARVLLIGRGSEEYYVQIEAYCPDLVGRVAATGELSPGEVAAHLRACDVLLQPYADGVSSRRTSVMAGLANLVPVVSNLGHLSEPFWASAAGVAVVPRPDPTELAAAAGEVLGLSPENRLALGARGAELYRSQFSVERTIARLRQR